MARRSDEDAGRIDGGVRVRVRGRLVHPEVKTGVSHWRSAAGGSETLVRGPLSETPPVLRRTGRLLGLVIAARSWSWSPSPSTRTLHTAQKTRPDDGDGAANGKSEMADGPGKGAVHDYTVTLPVVGDPANAPRTVLTVP